MAGMRTLCFAFLIGAVVMAAPARLDPPGNSTPDEIVELHEAIKARFLDTRDFGMRRILPRQVHGIREFSPENVTELSIINKLQKKGYNVAFFLAGRNILSDTFPADSRRFSVQGPAFMTPSRQGEFPASGTLLADSRRALVAFETGEGYTIQKTGWTVAMRPLRATGEACVRCHKLSNNNPNLKVGDPMGVALYVFKKK